MFAREGSTVLWWQLYAGGIGCGRYAPLKEVHRPQFRGIPLKELTSEGPARHLPPRGVQNFGYPPPAYHPQGRFGPVRSR